MTTRRRHDGRGDDGVVLVMAMVVVIVFGAVAAAIAGFAGASFKHTRTVREQTNLRASADAGVRITIDQMIRHQSLCNSFPASPTRLTPTPNEAAIDVQCSYLSGDAVGASNWALFLTADVGASVPVLHTNAGLTLNGSVFLADPPATAFPKIDVAAGLNITNGDLWYNDDNCTGVPPGSIISLTGILGLVPPRTAQCTTTDWRSLVPTIILPPRPADISDSQGTDVDDDALGIHCRVFSPGTYKHPPALANNRANYFESGDYYFEFPSDDSTLVIPTGTDNPVIGGAIDPTLGDTATIDPGGCAGASAQFDTPGSYGVTWFLGGASRIDVGLGGKLELFRRRQVAQAVSIATVEEDEGCSASPDCYHTSTATADTGPILTTNALGVGGSTVVIHGLVSAPRGQARIGGLVSVTPAFRGGAVLGSLDVTAFVSVSLADLDPQPSQTKLVIASTATDPDGTDVTVQAVVDYLVDPAQVPDTQVAINSWRKV